MQDESNKKTRRVFIKNAAIIAAAPAILKSQVKKQLIVHHVFFWLKDPLSATDKKELMDGLATLKKIPQIQKLMIGTPAATAKRAVVDNSFQVSELAYFNSIEDQDAYQVHPVHQAFVKEYSHLWERVVVYDMNINTWEK